MPQTKRRKLNNQSAAVQVEADVAADRTPDLPVQRVLKSIVCQKLHGRRDVPAVGNEEEREKVRDLIAKTVEAGESNSMLLIGPRGSGKTKAVSDALKSLAKTTEGAFHVVRLSGLIQRDDKLALREIMRQLGKQLSEEDDAEEQAKNYSDTLTKLIATLSSNANAMSTDPMEVEVATSVIFILDEFDLFSLHPRQTLLYNLFDIAQSSSRRTPIAVLGLTTKVNAVDMLEKRVKSRFSHRSVYFKPPDTFTQFKQRCLSALHVTTEELADDELSTLGRAGAVEEQILRWNGAMDQLLELDWIARDMTYTFYTSKSVPNALINLATTIPSVTISAEGNPILPTNSSLLDGLLPQDNKLYIIPELPQLALSLLVCAARLEVVHCSDLMNFNMAYDEYATLISRSKSVSLAANSGLGVARTWSPSISIEMWNQLVEHELLIPATGTPSTRRLLRETEMCRIDVSLEEIRDAAGGIDPLLREWCKI